MGMSKNKGARARTRKLFCKNRIQKKENNSQIEKISYKINDSIIIKPNSSFQKDLPNKWYFGKIGRIIGITKTRAKVGLKKKIKNKKFFKTIILNKIHIRHINSKIH